MPARPQTPRQRIEVRIARCRDDAFLTRAFLDLGGERQVLRELPESGELIRLGYGASARAEISASTERPMFAGDGFGAVSRQVLDKLKLPWEAATAERDGNEGRTAQVPVAPRVRLRNSRFSWQAPPQFDGADV